MKMLRFSAIFLALTASVYSYGQADNALSPNEKKDGWILLFDGKTLNGWHNFKKTAPGQAWEVKDGTLHLNVETKEGRGDILTDGDYENFHLVFDWKVAPKANSGIIFMVQDKEPYQATWHTGPEYQMIDNVNYPSKLNEKQLSASLYDLIACPAGFVRPAGEWNTGAILMNKGSLTFYVNGKLAISTSVWTDDWNKMIAGSKFIKEKDFAKFARGHIAIQDHGGEVWLKNLKIKTL